MKEPFSYEKAGVSIANANAAKAAMAERLHAADPRVLNRLGAFASLFEASFPGYRRPVLVLKMEEPGSKALLALKHGSVRGLALDLVHHLVNDVAVMGARPLAMLDTIICGKLEKAVVVELVDQMASACRSMGFSLVGGETSEQPGVLAPGMYLLSGAILGVVEADAVVDGSRIEIGDQVLAVASNGLHTNGYSLVRRLLEARPDLAERPSGAGTAAAGPIETNRETFLQAVLKPHLSYLTAIERLQALGGLHGLAHITGGGIGGNLNRILPPGTAAGVDVSRLRILPVFKAIRDAGSVPDEDMLRTFNLGAGLTAVVSAGAAARAQMALQEIGLDAYPIGEIVPGDRQVRLSGRLCW